MSCQYQKDTQNSSERAPQQADPVEVPFEDAVQQIMDAYIPSVVDPMLHVVVVQLQRASVRQIRKITNESGSTTRPLLRSQDVPAVEGQRAVIQSPRSHRACTTARRGESNVSSPLVCSAALPLCSKGKTQTWASTCYSASNRHAPLLTPSPSQTAHPCSGP